MPHQADSNSFGFLVTDLARLIRAEFERHVTEAGLGLTAGEARTLVHAARAGEVRQAMLAEQMGVEAMTLTAYLDRLQSRGLVERKPDPDDGRANLVCLTGKAPEMIENIRCVAASIGADASRGMTDSQWTQLRELLLRVQAGLLDARCKALRKDGDTQ